jgi:hypothetical protein
MATDLQVDRAGTSAPVAREPYVPSGPDRERFDHVETTIAECAGPRGAKPLYDSVVVVGGHGITSHTFAARLARSPEFAGNVVLAGPGPVEDRRLKAGVSLRGAACDFLAYALNRSTDDVVRQIAGTHNPAPPIAYRQTASMAWKDRATGRYTHSRVGTWQGGRNGLTRPGMYGFRNSRTAMGIKELSNLDGIVERPEPVTSLDHARSLATGRRPLVVNVTTNAGLLGNPTFTPKQAIVAVQMPYREPRDGLRAPFAPATTYAPLVLREGTIDVGYFTPFSDPLSTAATWYGINARPVDLKKRVDKEREFALLLEELGGCAEMMGLIPVDPEETTGKAFVPAPPVTAPKSSLPGTLELRRACTPWIAAYYADGMTGGTVGSLMAAEAVLRGADPYPAVARALRRYRVWNWAWYAETVKIPGIADFLLRTVGAEVAMVWPHSLSLNYWFSRA